MSVHKYSCSERPRRTGQQGMTLIELLIALTILVIGMGGVMIMIATAIAQNNGTKHDSSGTMLAQMVTEQISSIPGNLNPPPANPTETDCAGTVHTIAVFGAPGPVGAGAALIAATGNIDFNQAPGGLGNYRMLYVGCGDPGRQPTYDVRWNVQTLRPNTKLITVSARRLNQSNRGGIGFNVPVTLRTIVGL